MNLSERQKDILENQMRIAENRKGLTTAPPTKWIDILCDESQMASDEEVKILDILCTKLRTAIYNHDENLIKKCHLLMEHFARKYNYYVTHRSSDGFIFLDRD